MFCVCVSHLYPFAQRGGLWHVDSNLSLWHTWTEISDIHYLSQYCLKKGGGCQVRLFDVTSLVVVLMKCHPL